MPSENSTGPGSAGCPGRGQASQDQCGWVWWQERSPGSLLLRRDGGTGLWGDRSSLSILGWGESVTPGKDRDLPKPGLLQASVSPPVTLKKGLGWGPPRAPQSGGAPSPRGIP